MDNEAGKIAVCWRNHVYIDTPTACSGEFHYSWDDETTTFWYGYDKDNRLAWVYDGMDGHHFAYDYRSRRYYRSTPDTPQMFSVFDGGLAVQEYEPDSDDLTVEPLSSTNLRTEFIRTEGMGGGVGGMLYSIAADGTRTFSHSNHRGDVIGRSNSSRSLTYFALYEAYGTRPYDWGDDPDRQKANTKEEESDLGLLNEGMRYRDLEAGVFLTRDPIGYGDGPNVYCYVHCNPITRFDPLGLKTISDYQGELRDSDQEYNEGISKLDKKWEGKDKTSGYYRAYNRLGEKHYRKQSSIISKINKIEQTAASMSALIGSNIDPDNLDDEWDSYKGYRRNDWYLKTTGTEKFASHAINGEYKEAAIELAKMEAIAIVSTMIGSPGYKGTGLGSLAPGIDDVVLTSRGNFVPALKYGGPSPKVMKGLSTKIIKNGKIDLSKFVDGKYKNWRLTPDKALHSGVGTHGPSHWKLINTTDKSRTTWTLFEDGRVYKVK